MVVVFRVWFLFFRFYIGVRWETFFVELFGGRRFEDVFGFGSVVLRWSFGV